MILTHTRLRWLLAASLLASLHAEALRVGFGTDKPPYIFETERRGLEYDIVVAAARRAGMEVVPSFAPMERLHRTMEKDALDAIATTNERSGIKAYYSKPYIEYHNAVAALASRHLDLRRIADLGRYTVSAFQRARFLLGDEFHAMADTNPGYREEAEQVVRNRLLFSGRIDAIVGDVRIISYFNTKVASQVNVTQPLRWYFLFPPTAYSVGFHSQAQRDRFDEALEAMRADGEYAAIERQYAQYDAAVLWRNEQ